MPELNDRLVFNPEISTDYPVVKGTWVTTGHLVSLIVDGYTWQDILRTHPELTEDDIRICLNYAMEQGQSNNIITVEAFAAKLKKPVAYVKKIVRDAQHCQKKVINTHLNVIRDGEYYYIHLGSKGEGGKYYFEMYLERWAADCTIIGLEAAWQNETVKQNDIDNLFTSYKHVVRLSAINRQYVREYGIDPRELGDEQARRRGMKTRIDDIHGRSTYSPLPIDSFQLEPGEQAIEL